MHRIELLDHIHGVGIDQALERLRNVGALGRREWRRGANVGVRNDAQLEQRRLCRVLGRHLAQHLEMWLVAVAANDDAEVVGCQCRSLIVRLLLLLLHESVTQSLTHLGLEACRRSGIARWPYEKLCRCERGPALQGTHAYLCRLGQRYRELSCRCP